MKLNQIANTPGAHKHKHKVGRGSSSGLGKTSGRGVKGAKARTGNGIYGFEGGQTPLHMRMPKRGFRNIFAKDFSEVNISRIQKAIDNKKLDAKSKITEDVLRKAGLAHKSKDGIRLLGKGAITAKIDIEVAGVSAGAKEAVEKAGGTVTTTYVKKVYKNKKDEPGKRQTRRTESAKMREARKA